MTHLESVRTSGLQIIERGNERVVVASFCGNNRPPQFARYQQKVFNFFRIPLNQIQVNFSRVYHGPAVDVFLDRIDGAYDYFLLFDSDAVPLKPDFLELTYNKIRDGRTLFGLAQQSNHIYVNNSKNHLYAGPGALAISRKMFLRLGRPSFAETHRSDTAEELTWLAEEGGYTVALMFPSHVHQRIWDLGNGHHFGLGTTYSNCVFHSFLQNKPASRKLFVAKCKSILARNRPRRTRAG